MRDYLTRLKVDLGRMGINAALQVMASNGGMMGVESASLKPVFAVASGPAGGVAGAARIGLIHHEKDPVVFDRGGTTANAPALLEGSHSLTPEHALRSAITAPSRIINGRSEGLREGKERVRT